MGIMGDVKQALHDLRVEEEAGVQQAKAAGARQALAEAVGYRDALLARLKDAREARIAADAAFRAGDSRRDTLMGELYSRRDEARRSLASLEAALAAAEAAVESAKAAVAEAEQKVNP